MEEPEEPAAFAGTTVCVVTRDEAGEARLTSSLVAGMLDVSQATVLRIPKEQLDYWVTPGGHRRYRRADVAAYARRELGREIPED